MSERADSPARNGKAAEPLYAKYAFANPYNLSLLAGAGSAALLTGHWWVGLCAVAAEAVWMLFAPDSRLLRKKWFDPIWESQQAEARKARQSAKFNALPNEEKERALRLRDQQKRIEKMAQDNASFTVDLLSTDIAKLEDLVDDFLDMASRTFGATPCSPRSCRWAMSDAKWRRKTSKCCCREKIATWICDGTCRPRAGRWI